MRSRFVQLTCLAALVFLVMSAHALSGQQPTEPKELPTGLYCNPKGIVGNNGLVIDPAHKCHCEHMTHSRDCEGAVEENAKCMSFCHKEKCRCPVHCDPVETQEN